MKFDLAEAREIASLSEDEVRRRLGPDAEEEPEDEYEGLEDLTSLYNPEVFPGTVYLRDGQVQMVYIGPGALDGVTREQIESQLSGKPAVIASRAGKTASMYVRADQGVAYSADAKGVHFIEVFPPRPQKDYKRQIWSDPGPFIR